MSIKSEAKLCDDDGNEVVKLKKKDSHALGLLCYAERELKERMADYLEGMAQEAGSILDKIYVEVAEDMCNEIYAELADIIDGIATAMIEEC